MAIHFSEVVTFTEVFYVLEKPLHRFHYCRQYAHKALWFRLPFLIGLVPTFSESELYIRYPIVKVVISRYILLSSGSTNLQIKVLHRLDTYQQ